MSVQRKSTHGGRRKGAGRPYGGATRAPRTYGIRPLLRDLELAAAAGETIGARVDRALELLASTEQR